MKRHFFLLMATVGILTTQAYAQQAYNVTETTPVTVDGLQMGYNIKSAEVKEVGDKGNFSRYSVKFYVTNTSSQAKIILYKEGWNVLGNISDELAQFNVLNATGARLTSKSAIINAAPCNVLGVVDDKCATDKSKKSKSFVQIGSWIKPGQTFSADAIVIVPLNEKPAVQAIYLADKLQPSASAIMPGSVEVIQGQPQQPVLNPEFSKIRNVMNNIYINNETGMANASPIQSGWWSAQWQLIPVPGTTNYNIKNRWKENYIGLQGRVLSMVPDPQDAGSWWLLLPTNDPNIFKIKNARTGGYLYIVAGQLMISNGQTTDASTTWTLERP